MYWIVTAVGVWRSASPYVAGPRLKKLWGWLARVLMVLWTARGLWSLADGGAVAVIAAMRGGS